MSVDRYPALHPVRVVPLVGVLLGTLAAIPAASAESGLIVRGGFESGGDTLFEGRLTDGDSASIEAGGGALLEVGVRHGIIGPKWETDLTVGVKADTENASNGDVSFTRVTLNAMQYYRFAEKIRFGAGVTYHLSPTLEVDVPGLRDEAEGESVVGYMLAADYVVTPSVELGIRATQLDYEFENGATVTVDGSGVGGYLTYRF